MAVACIAQSTVSVATYGLMKRAGLRLLKDRTVRLLAIGKVVNQGLAVEQQSQPAESGVSGVQRHRN